MLRNLTKKFDKIVLLGDFNVNFLSDSKEKHCLTNTLLSFNLEAIINEPTRVTDHSSTCIDNICVNFDNYKKSGTIKEELSDHYGLYIIMEGNEKLNGNKKIHNNRRHITETGAAEFKHYVNKIDMSDFYLSEDPNFLSRFLCENITYAIELAFPLKHSKQGTDPKWFNRDLKIMREELKQKKTQYRITGNSEIIIPQISKTV
ncbi:hypothetical protein JTB14_026031 [Gonioctena quinquepunctata]|nr:hypothetical protein JTB14_026031 [Gonioctena quinquepunctata]